MKSKITSLFLMLSLVFTATLPAIAAFAQSAPTPAVSASPSPVASPAVSAPAQAPAPAVAQAPADATSDFLSQVLQAIQKFGGLSTLMKVSTVILLIVASMKVSILNQLIWSKLGAFQSLVAPALGLVAGILGLFGGSAPVTIASVLAYFGAGVGAMGLHELLDDIKSLPGIGPQYVAIIGVIESILGGPAAQAAPKA